MTNCLVITGGSRGIGKATVLHFQRCGWSVINISRSKCDVDGVSNILADFSQEDWQLGVSEQLQSLVKEAERMSLIHCAAANYKSTIADMPTKEFEKSLRINLIAPSALNQILIPSMKSGSSILYVGSTLSTKAVPNAASYVIAKHAVVGMMRATCQDLDNSGIHTGCICPGFTDTEMLQEYCQHDPAVLESLTQMVSARRLIEPEEIAKTLYFCAENPVINGALLHANLGQIER